MNSESKPNLQKLNRRQAIEAMLSGKVVCAIDPLYMNHEDPPTFRWNDQRQHFEFCQYPNSKHGEPRWSVAKNALYLASEFQLL